MVRKQRIKIENGEGVFSFGDDTTINYTSGKSHQAKPAAADDTSGGPLKVKFCRRLGESWRDLADFLGIPAPESARFKQGNEARKIWEWLAERNRWPELEPALRAIDRPDLADLVAGGGS